MKQIYKYVGSNHKKDSNTQGNIDKDNIFKNPNPKYLIYEYGSDDSNITRFKQLELNNKAGEYVKKRLLIKENFQKVYSLLLGQFTKLMEYKLKISSKGINISYELDVLKLSSQISMIKLKFENQKYFLLYIHETK